MSVVCASVDVHDEFLQLVSRWKRYSGPIDDQRIFGTPLARRLGEILTDHPEWRAEQQIWLGNFPDNVLPFSAEQRRETAVHEAGHTVCLYRLGVPIRFATLESFRIPNHAQLHARGYTSFDTTQLEPRDEAILCLMGAVAQITFGVPANVNQAFEESEPDVRRATKAINNDHWFLVECLDASREFAALNASAIRTTADALLVRKTICAVEIEQLIRNAS
jgi:hypothetical protein